MTRCPRCHGTMREEREVYGHHQHVSRILRCLCGYVTTTPRRPKRKPKKRTGPTPANLHVLAALSRVILRQGRATTVDIAQEAGLTKSTVHSHLHALKRFGLVEWEQGKAGTITPMVRS